jgi:hypothetical protein
VWLHSSEVSLDAEKCSALFTSDYDPTEGSCESPTHSSVHGYRNFGDRTFL